MNLCPNINITFKYTQANKNIIFSVLQDSIDEFRATNIQQITTNKNCFQLESF
jgi:hypothetical protein